MTPEIVAVVERIVGPVARWTEHTQGHGVTRVYRADHIWVKVHGGSRKYAQELAAYREVVPGLAAAGFAVPTLLACDASHHVLVLSHVPGVPGEAIDDRRDLHRQAGELLAVLHALPCMEGDPVSVPEAIVARTQQWCARARPHLPHDVLRRVEDRIGTGDAFAGMQRCWCHRDFSARNWLVDDGRLGLIDFEHTRPDLWPTDLVKLADDDWLRQPGTREAFFSGHPPLSPDDVERLDQLLWLHAVSTVAWAEAHGDAPYAAHARRLLDYLTASSASRISSAEL